MDQAKRTPVGSLISPPIAMQAAVSTAAIAAASGAPGHHAPSVTFSSRIPSSLQALPPEVSASAPSNVPEATAQLPAEPMSFLAGPPPGIQFVLTSAPQSVAFSGVTDNICSSALFDRIKVRRGKWTPEEEAYAELLIKEFENGTAEGCENGDTLRAFLSKKLHCAPMRISKKFAGKSIGKHVFFCRSAVLGLSPREETRETGDNQQRLKDLEMKFLRSLLNETEFSKSFVPPVTQNIGKAFTHDLRVIPQSSVIASGAFAQGTPPFISFNGQSVPPQIIAAPYVWTSGIMPHQQMEVLHQSYLSALNKPCNAYQPSPSRTSADTAVLGSSCGPSSIASGNEEAPPRIQGQPCTVLEQHRAQSHDKSTTRDSFSMNLKDQQKRSTKSNRQSVAGAAHPGQEFPSKQLDIPDFLSGFEKLAAKASTWDPSQVVFQPTSANLTAPYSPTFTSRSFDDFHKHLGTGLSPRSPPRPLDLNDDSNKAPSSVSLGVYTGSSVSADSYAVFAQQSALAVSQHSAYYRCPAISSSVPSIPLPPLGSSNPETGIFTPSVVNAANLRTHSLLAGGLSFDVSSHETKNIVSASERSNSECGTNTEESESTGLASSPPGSGTESNTNSADNSSDSNSNYSDYNSDTDGPTKKRIKRSHKELKKKQVLVSDQTNSAQ